MLVGAETSSDDGAEHTWTLRNVADRLVEVRVVEEVEELESHAELCCLPARNLEVLHDGHVGIEVPRSAVLIAGLVAESGWMCWCLVRTELERDRAYPD